MKNSEILESTALELLIQIQKGLEEKISKDDIAKQIVLVTTETALVNIILRGKNQHLDERSTEDEMTLSAYSANTFSHAIKTYLQYGKQIGADVSIVESLLNFKSPDNIRSISMKAIAMKNLSDQDSPEHALYDGVAVQCLVALFLMMKDMTEQVFNALLETVQLRHNELAIS